MSVRAKRTAQWHSLGESKLPSRTAPSRSGTRPQGTTSGEGLARRTTTTSYRQRTRPVAPKLAKASSRRLWHRAARSSRSQGSTTAKAKPAKATEPTSLSTVLDRWQRVGRKRASTYTTPGRSQPLDRSPQAMKTALVRPFDPWYRVTEASFHRPDTGPFRAFGPKPSSLDDRTSTT